MDRYVPLNKKSKKEQKKYHAMQRSTWGINPATRTVPNGKGYDRNKIKAEDKRNSRNFTNEKPAVFFFNYILQLSAELKDNKCTRLCLIKA